MVEKKDGLPVYKICNLKKGKDIRVVHRNKLMKCEELPLDVFEDPKQSVETSSKKVKKVKTNDNDKEPMSNELMRPREPAHQEQHIEVESDDEDVAVIMENGGPESSVVEVVEEAVEPTLNENFVEEAGEFENTDVDEETSTIDSVGGSDAEEADSEESDAEESTEDGDSAGEGELPPQEPPQPGRSRFGRTIKPRKVFSYAEAGGNPIMEVADAHGATTANDSDS